MTFPNTALATVRGRRSTAVGLVVVAAVAAVAFWFFLSAATTAEAQTPMCRGERATIVGTPGDDELVGTNRRDVIVGRGGDDIIDGRGGPDLICAGPGNDRVFGGSGADTLVGNAGQDFIYGGGGPDLMIGGAGNDHLYGEFEDRDRARGGPGEDFCIARQRVGCDRDPVRPTETARAFVADAVAGRSIVAYFSGRRLLTFDPGTLAATYEPFDPRLDVGLSERFFAAFRGSAYSVSFEDDSACGEWNGGDTSFSCTFTFTSGGERHEITMFMNFGYQILSIGVPGPVPTIELRQGREAPFGYWYDVTLSGFLPRMEVTLYCNDSEDERFWTQTIRTNRRGQARDATLCFSADGPFHQVTSDTNVRSNPVEW